MAKVDDLQRRVLIASRSGQLGGMELRLADEARFLSQRGVASLLAISPFPGSKAWLHNVTAESSLIGQWDFNPPAFFEDHWRWRYVNLLRANAYWPARLRKLSVCLVHIPFAWTFEGGSRLWLCTKASVPSVLSVHNTFPSIKLTSWHTEIAKFAFQGVKGVYGVSTSALGAFLQIYGEFLPSNAVRRVVHNFVEVNRFVSSHDKRVEMRGRLGIPLESFVVGSVGRIDEQKEPIRVLKVFQRLLSLNSSAYLVFCGAGPLDNAVRHYIHAHALSDKVRLLGFRADTENVFPAFDVHILVSKQEGFGIANLEAMSCEVPVVATDVPGTRDLLQGSAAGLLVSYGDDARICDALMHFARSRADREKAGHAGRAWAIRKFSREVWAKELGLFYDATL